MDRGLAPTAVAISDDNYMERNFERFLDSFFGADHPKFCPAKRAWNPPTDIFETHDSLCIKMELAGVREEDISVVVEGRFLTIRAQRCDDLQVKPENYHLMEIQYGEFERVFRLPRPMHEPNVTAILKNGFLLVTIPKPVTHPKTELRIEIR